MKEKRKVLVVEDEAPMAKMLATLLTRAGYAVQTVCNAEEAVKQAECCGFDLITLDVDMPGANGFTVYQRLKQIPHLKDTPVVFISGRTSEEDRDRALALGAVDFIQKPFAVKHFLLRIVSLVEESSAT
jgi:DNA-binding response OmpR family regulator